MDNKTKDAIKQLQAEIRQLQSIVTLKRADGSPDGVVPDEGIPPRKDKEFAVQCIVFLPASGGGAESKKKTTTASSAQLARVTNDAAAALGYALASPQKVALLRALLGKVSESAANLGEATGLSTGSLYHHLRELMRAELIHLAARNRYELTERGARTLLVLLALAHD